MSDTPTTGDDLRRFLVRAVLDDDFRELAITDPDQAMEGFELSDHERDVLRRREGDVLGLLGSALHGAGVRAKPGAVASDQARTDEPAPDTPMPETIAVSSLREMRLMLRLVPAPIRGPGGEVEVRYAASLHPLAVEQPAEPAPPAASPAPRPEAIQDAAREVQSAPTGERLDRLVELARTVSGKPPR